MSDKDTKGLHDFIVFVISGHASAITLSSATRAAESIIAKVNKNQHGLETELAALREQLAAANEDNRRGQRDYCELREVADASIVAAYEANARLARVREIAKQMAEDNSILPNSEILEWATDLLREAGHD